MFNLLAQSISWNTLPAIIAGIGIVATGLAAIVAYRKARPEATAIIVDAAKDIVILQKGELNRLQESLETAHKSLESANLRIEDLEKENDTLRRKITVDEKRIAELERRLDEIDSNK